MKENDLTLPALFQPQADHLLSTDLSAIYGCPKLPFHLGLWEEEVRVCSGTDPPPEPIVEPWFDDPFPACLGAAKRRRDYDTELVTGSATWSLTSPCHFVTPFAMERQAFGFGLPPTRGRAESDFLPLRDIIPRKPV